MPIDPNFQTTRQLIEDHGEHKVYGPAEPPLKFGIHGAVVAVDFEVCIADGVCIDVCPVDVFEWMETPGCMSPNESGQAALEEKKADPVRESDCIFCMACEVQCPTLAIKIIQP